MQLVRAWILLPLLAACTGEDAPVDMPTAWTYSPSGQEDAVDPQTIQSEVQDLLGNIRNYNGRPTLEAYSQVREYGDTQCPAEVTTESEENGTSVYFERLCVASDLYWFKGPMTTYDFTENELQAFEVFDIHPYMDFDGTLWTGQAMKGQTDIFSSDDAHTIDYNCSCTAFAAVSPPSDTENKWLSYTDGPTHFTAPEAYDTWINQGIQSHLYMKFTKNHAEDRWEAEIVGSVTGAEEVYGDIEVDLLLQGDVTGAGEYACDADRTATIEARHTTTGKRTSMEFTMPGGSCEACTEVDGTDVCIDFSTLIDWEGTPW